MAQAAGRGKRVGITRERVIDGAIELVEAEGPDALTMRRLAAYLGLKPMSLYSHVSSKEELLDYILLKVMQETEVRTTEGRAPRDIVAEAATSYYRAMRRRPGVASLVLRRPVRGDTSIWLETVDWRQKILEEMGLTKTQAVDAHRSLVSLTGGALLNELGAPRIEPASTSFSATPLFDSERYPHLAEVIDEYFRPDFERSFRVGLEALLDGFEALARRNQKRRV